MSSLYRKWKCSLFENWSDWLDINYYFKVAFPLYLKLFPASSIHVVKVKKSPLIYITTQCVTRLSVTLTSISITPDIFLSLSASPLWTALPLTAGLPCFKAAARQNHVLSHPWRQKYDGDQKRDIESRGETARCDHRRRRRKACVFTETHALPYVVYRMWIWKQHLFVFVRRLLLIRKGHFLVKHEKSHIAQSTLGLLRCASVWHLFQSYKCLLSQSPWWNCSRMREILTGLWAEYWIFQKVNKGLDH